MLNPRQERFAEAYARHNNATQAAKDAGYSDRSAHVTGCRLLKQANVRERINHYHAERHMGPEETMAALADIARLNMGDFITPLKNGGAKLNLAKAKRLDKLGFVREVKTKERRIMRDGDEIGLVVDTTVKLYDRQRALETIARHHGLLKDTEINIHIKINFDIMVTAWETLEGAGVDPEAVFNELIEAANARRENVSPASN